MSEDDRIKKTVSEDGKRVTFEDSKSTVPTININLKRDEEIERLQESNADLAAKLAISAYRESE
jgi:hypothetical protein